MPTSLQTELAAILHHAAIAPLHDCAFLRITGPDATRWLNGMVTNSIQALAPGEGNYNLLLNAQGRIQADCTVYREPDGNQPAFILETDKSQIDTIQAHLDHFIIMDDVELTRTFEDKLGMLVIGPEALATLDAALMWPPPPISISEAKGFDGSFILAVAKDRYEVWTDSWTVDWMGDIERNKVSPEALDAFRILEARPLFGRDITEKYLPQEINQPHALHFAKGCYLGQEIVERIRSRGQVHRLLTPLTLTGTLPTELPASLHSPEEGAARSVGEITSAAVVPLPEGPQLLALGYVRREALDTHQTLTYNGGTAAPRT
jgi:folate-binding protein YgfZ